jgi:hypothetical protein
MPELPDLLHAPRPEVPAASLGARALIKLQPTMSFEVARAVPGAIYDPAERSMVLPVPTARAAIVALTLSPALANEYPELEALRDQLLVDVRPTDYASKLGLHVDAPHVHQWLLDQGHDWLEFADGSNQDTDLGYASAILNKFHAFYLGWARGYGKTLGTAALIEANGYKRVLIAAPNSSKVDTWVAQLLPLLPGYTIKVMPNEKQKRNELIEWLKAGHLPERLVLIAHHESLKLVAQYGTKTNAATFHGWRWLKQEWDLLAIDEGHRFANYDTKQHRAARHIPRRNTLILSGSEPPELRLCRRLRQAEDLRRLPGGPRPAAARRAGRLHGRAREARQVDPPGAEGAPAPRPAGGLRLAARRVLRHAGRRHPGGGRGRRGHADQAARDRHRARPCLA